MSDDVAVEEAVPETVEAVEEPAVEATETVTMSKAEADALRREVAEQRKTAKKLASAAEVAERKRLEEEGQYQTLASQAEDRATVAEARAKELEQRQLISQVASRLKFRDSADAVAHLKDRGIEADDEASVENALAALATEKSYLIEQSVPQRTGGSVSSDAPQTVTIEALRGMTPAQVAALDPAEVHRALSGS
jgi:hypothetical protein